MSKPFQVSPHQRPRARPSILVLTAAAALGCAAPRRHVTPSMPSAEPLPWLAGCWRRTSGTTVTDEQWMLPAAGLLMGMSRTVREGVVVEYEHTRIERRGETLVLVAMPSGQATAEFTAPLPTSTRVVFENPGHDFPQRVSYALGSADSLIARIEGVRNGVTRGVDFRYAKVPCTLPEPGLERDEVALQFRQ